MNYYLTAVFTNKYVTIPALTWFLAQLFKLIVTLVKKEKDFSRLIGTGGMPSSHSCFVVSLCAVIGKNAGLDSVAFGISFALAMIVMSDAAGVRHEAGKQAKLINALMTSQFPGEQFNERLKELLGHKPLEVLVGALLGIVTGVLLG